MTITVFMKILYNKVFNDTILEKPITPDRSREMLKM